MSSTTEGIEMYAPHTDLQIYPPKLAGFVQEDKLKFTWKLEMQSLGTDQSNFEGDEQKRRT